MNSSGLINAWSSSFVSWLFWIHISVIAFVVCWRHIVVVVSVDVWLLEWWGASWQVTWSWVNWVGSIIWNDWLGSVLVWMRVWWLTSVALSWIFVWLEQLERYFDLKWFMIFTFAASFAWLFATSLGWWLSAASRAWLTTFLTISSSRSSSFCWLFSILFS